MTNTKELEKQFFKILPPQCPYCNGDIKYVYYGDYNGKRYCPNCGNELKGDVE